MEVVKKGRAGIPGYLPRSPFERAMERFVPEPNSGCWIWEWSLDDKGYGRIGETILGRRSRSRLAHRVIYEGIVGAIPSGLELDHKCRNRCCVNPDHLEPVTRLVNTMRGNLHKMLKEKWASTTHCKNGHEKTSENSYLDRHGHTVCRVCKRENQRRCQAKKRGGR